MQPPLDRERRPGRGAAHRETVGTRPKFTAVSGFAPALLELRRQRIATRMHALGVRALYEAIEEIGAPAWRVVEKYVGALTPELLRAVGGDRFPRRPLHEALR